MMVYLERTVRFCLNGSQQPVVGTQVDHEAVGCRNTYSAWPAMQGLGRYHELQVGCYGPVDPQTGYCLNIKRIDEAVQRHVVPFLESTISQATTDIGPRGNDTIALGLMMQGLLDLLIQAIEQPVLHAKLALSRYYSLAIRSNDVNHVLIGQHYEFSAAHRLHVPRLSDEENRQLFGKCNNPSGHGHNYRLEVCVRAPIDQHGQVSPIEPLDTIVHEAVIEKLDHKHLNIDVPQFADLNPSVEHIAMVIYDLLRPHVTKLGVSLDSVRVWETEKTVCTYCGHPSEQPQATSS